jgi:hypothetical protein
LYNQNYIIIVPRMSLSLDEHDVSSIAQNQSICTKRKRKDYANGSYCNGSTCRTTKINISTLFELVENVISATETNDIKHDKRVSICAFASCTKKHTGMTLNISEYVTTEDEVLFIGKLLGLDKMRNRVLDVDIRKIVVALDYLCTIDTFNVINDTMQSGYGYITTACAASIYESNQHRTFENRLICNQFLRWDEFVAWYDMSLFESTDRSQICQVFNTTMLAHGIDQLGARSIAFGATHIHELLAVISNIGFIGGLFAAAVAQKLPYVPPKDSGSVDVFIFSKLPNNENSTLVMMASWASQAGYVQEPRRSLDTITYKRDNYVPVVLRFSDRTLAGTLWNYEADFLRACIVNELHVHYYPIAVKDWVDRTYTKSGFMIESLLYPHNRDHCRDALVILN